MSSQGNCVHGENTLAPQGDKQWWPVYSLSRQDNSGWNKATSQMEFKEIQSSSQGPSSLGP